jgi:hypothetical protein
MLAPAATDNQHFHGSPRKNRAEDRGWEIEDRNHRPPSSLFD